AAPAAWPSRRASTSGRATRGWTWKCTTSNPAAAPGWCKGRREEVGARAVLPPPLPPGAGEDLPDWQDEPGQDLAAVQNLFFGHQFGFARAREHADGA